MRTRISPANPHTYPRYSFAWEHVPAGGEAHLDFGCNDGKLLHSLRSKGIARLVGVDISSEAVAKARRDYPQLEVLHIRRTVPLPFEDGRFTSVTVLDVLEHVYEQVDLLDELHRLLTPAGVLIVTVPRKNLFSFLDVGNWKFLFPRLHRWYHRRLSADQYRRRFQAHPDGLIGDISARKRWHEHFTAGRLAELLRGSGFEVVEFDGSGLLTRPLSLAGRLLGRFERVRRILVHLSRLDGTRYETSNLFCVARKA